jgi:hypothetical protein
LCIGNIRTITQKPNIAAEKTASITPATPALCRCIFAYQPAPELTALGIEPSKTGRDVPANFKFPGAAGQKSDTSPAGAVLGADQAKWIALAQDPEVRKLLNVWPRLSDEVRASILALAAASASPGR